MGLPGKKRGENSPPYTVKSGLCSLEHSHELYSALVQMWAELLLQWEFGLGYSQNPNLESCSHNAAFTRLFECNFLSHF